MDNFLRARVRERLSALGLNPFEAARRMGVDRTFVNDLLSGKKETMRPKAILKAAAALDCDPEFLIGAQATPRRARDGDGGLMPLAGICEAGVWRSQVAEPMPSSLPVAFDPRYPRERQAAYLIRGHHADALNLSDGDVLVSVRDEPVRDGDVVIFRRRRGNESELSARAIIGGILRAGWSPNADSIQQSDGEVIARVVFAHRIFGSK